MKSEKGLTDANEDKMVFFFLFEFIYEKEKLARSCLKKLNKGNEIGQKYPYFV